MTNSGASFLSRLPLFADVSAETLACLEHRTRRLPAAVVKIDSPVNRLTRDMSNPSNVVAFDDVRRAIRRGLIEPAVATDAARRGHSVRAAPLAFTSVVSVDI